MRAVNICSPSWDPYNSYGRIALELADELNRVTPVNMLGDGAPQHVLQAVPGGIMMGYPNIDAYGIMPSLGPRIIITMFESTILPDGWRDALNRYDAVIVPSRFLVDVFRANGVTTRIDVVPLGISATFKRFSSRRTSEPFTFLAIADRGARKGWVDACFAFYRAFGEDMRYRLILKARADTPGVRIGNPNIEIVYADYSESEMLALYQRCHVMVFATRGEGFGFPPREFAATGGLAIATNWGGTADDIHDWGLPIPYRMVSAWDDQPQWRGQLGDWAAADIDALANTMRSVAERYDEYVKFRAQASQFVCARYQWSQFATAIWAVWNEVCDARTQLNGA